MAEPASTSHSFSLSLTESEGAIARLGGLDFDRDLSRKRENALVNPLPFEDEGVWVPERVGFGEVEEARVGVAATSRPRA